MNEKKAEFNILWVLLMGILVLHVYIFNKIPLQYDELLMYDIISHFPYKLLTELLLTFEIQMPLPYYLAKKLFEMFGDNSGILRLPSLLFTLGLSFFYYKLARLSFNRNNALKALCLMMLAHPLLLFSGSMRPYAMMIFFQVIVLYNFKKDPVPCFDRSPMEIAKTSAALLLLALSHPLGVVFSFVFLGHHLFSSREHRKYFYRYMGIFLIALALYVEYRFKGVMLILNSGRNLLSIVDYLRKLSFIFSGGVFSLLILILSGTYLYKKKNFKGLDHDYVQIFFWSAGIGAFLLLFFPEYAYPRHLLLTLPLIPLMIISMLDDAFDKMNIQNVFFGLAMVVLIYKSFIKEDIQHRPYEIDSKGVALKSQELSEEKLSIINCGNCLSYYIKSNKLQCMNSFNRKGLVAAEEIVFVDFDYSRAKCKVRFVSDFYDVAESYPFKGATVYKMKPKL